MDTKVVQVSTILLAWALNQDNDREEGKGGTGRVERQLAERNVAGLIPGG